MGMNEEYWNKRAVSYDDQVMDKYADAYEETIERSLAYCKEDDEMLEIACGTGIMTLALAEKIRDITAVDISEEMIRKLRDKAGDSCEGLTVMHADVFDQRLDGRHFDVIAAFNLLLYIEDIEGMLGRILSLLKPGGIFLSATDCVGGLDTTDAEEKRKRVEKGELSFVGSFIPEELEGAIEKAGFDIIESRNVHKGTPNQFIAAKKRL